MTFPAHNSRRLAAVRALVLLLFLPAHLAIIILTDLDFLPGSESPASVRRDEDPGQGKERHMRLNLHRHPESRAASPDLKLVARDLSPWALAPAFRPAPSAGESVATTLTKPASIRIWLPGNPHSHRAPPA